MFNWVCFDDQRIHWLIFGVLAIGILLRFLYLDADPYYYAFAGYIPDEGRWIQAARNLVLFGKSFEPDQVLHFIMAPFFQLANYIIFKLSGVSLLTSRILTALCGSIILVLFWKYLRRVVACQALMLGIVLLSSQPDLIMMSRVAIPEMAIMFLQLLIYFIIVASNSVSPHRMFLAGLLLFLAVGVKLTMLPFLFIFSIIILLMPRQKSGAKIRKQTWRDLVSFWTGFALPLIIMLLILSFYFTEKLFSSLLDCLLTLDYFIHLKDIYHIFRFPFDISFPQQFYFWVIALWLSLLGWMVASRDGISFQSRRYLATSVIWFTLYFLLMLMLEYFPRRYQIHILIPMAIIITVGISILQRVTLWKVIESLMRGKGPTRIIWTAIVALPAVTLLLFPILSSALGMIVTDPDRLRYKLACIIILFIVTTYIAYYFRDNKKVLTFFLIFPLIATMAWLLLDLLRASSFPFWRSQDKQFHALFSLPFLFGISVVSFILIKTKNRWQKISRDFLIIAFATGFLVISLVSIAPGYIDPHYSIKNTSRDLGRLLYGYDKIVTIRGATLFSENSLRYKRYFSPSDMPDVFVFAYNFQPNLEHLKKKYRLAKSYELYFSPDYYFFHPEIVTFSPPLNVVNVYELNQ